MKLICLFGFLLASAGMCFSNEIDNDLMSIDGIRKWGMASLKQLETIQNIKFNYTLNHEWNDEFLMKYGAVSGTEYLKSTATVSYVGVGFKYAWDMTAKSSSTGAIKQFHGAFDGDDTETIAENGASKTLHLSKGDVKENYMGVIRGTNPFFLPFDFLVKNKRIDFIGTLGLGDISSPKSWEDLLPSWHILPSEMIDEKRCVVFRVDGTNGFYDKVYISDLGCPFPIRIQRFDSKNRLGYAFDVTEIGSVNVGGSKMVFPKKEEYVEYFNENYPEDVIAWVLSDKKPYSRKQTITMDSLSLNVDKLDGKFVLDSSGVDSIYNLDSGKSIELRKGDGQ